MNRKFGNGGDVLSDLLESVGVRNMIQDESDESDERSDIDFGVDWIQLAISNDFQRHSLRSSSSKPKKNEDVDGNVEGNSLTRRPCSTGTFTIPLVGLRDILTTKNSVSTTGCRGPR